MPEIHDFGLIEQKNNLTYTVCPNCKFEFPIAFEISKNNEGGTANSWDELYSNTINSALALIKNSFIKLIKKYPDSPPEGRYILIKPFELEIKNKKKIK